MRKTLGVFIPNNASVERGRFNLDDDKASRYISDDLRKAVLDRDNHSCVRCSSTLYLEIDHAVPHGMGGLSVMENLQTLCHGCNQKKGMRKWWGKTLREEGLKKCGGEQNLNLLLKRTFMENF